MLVNIVGAGISGPAAAITMADRGHDVTVYEQRKESQLRSEGILGITQANWDRLDRRYVNLSWELGNSFTNANTPQTYTSPLHYITWTDLHLALVEAAKDLGVHFEWETPYTERADDDLLLPDITVWASGIGTASTVTTSHYTGYAIIRGSTPQFANTDWTALHFDSELGESAFMVGDTHHGASITLFVPRDDIPMRTTYSHTPPEEIWDLPFTFQQLADSVTEWQTSPMSDWDVPDTMVTRSKRHSVIRIGHANIQLRPATAMAANLGMQEAFYLPGILAYNTQEAETLHIRRQWTQYGQRAGI